MKKRCFDCIHKKNIPGNAHVRCVHPSIKVNDMDDFMSAFGGGPPTQNPKELNIKAIETGILGGWFMFPLNFDPTWLTNCDGFEEIDGSD